MGVKAAFAALVGVVSALALAPTAEGSFPGHNGKFAFERPAQQGSGGCCVTHIFTANPDGSGQVDITPTSDVFVNQPAWSADGQKLVVNGMTTMNADGSNRQPSGAGGTPGWSPDGTKLTAVRNGDLLPTNSHNLDLFVMNVDGTNQVNLINDPPGDGPDEVHPDWSPDGTRIAFESNRTFPLNGSQRGIFTIAPNGQGLQRLTAGAADSNPDWSPDGTKIVFEHSANFSDGEVYVMNADGSGVRQVTDNAVTDENPVWSPDGRKIAFVRETQIGHFGIWVMNVDGSDQHEVIADGRFPDWQPLVPNHPPDCTSLTADPAVLAPPKNRLVPVTVTGATDPDGDAVTFTATGVTQDEPVGPAADAVTGPDRARSACAQSATGPATVASTAWRSEATTASAAPARVA